ncbi:MAG: sulfite exporter TauE/SafE family protein [Bacteroidota bacterium]
MDWILTGLALGFLGSLHCVGMCGPLALALPSEGSARWRFVGGRVVYNLGRVVTYAGLGVLFGLVGRIVSLGGYQQWLSLVLGVVLLVGAVLPWATQRVRLLGTMTTRALGKLVGTMRHLYQRQGGGGLFVVGLLNGLLPCGLVYAALATATTAGELVGSVTFMAAFGTGTIPAMLVLSLAGAALSVRRRARLQRLIPWGLGLLGLLLILRALSLGVFLSPDLRAALFTPTLCRYLPLVEPFGG